jgi:hypothetical protein
VVTRPSLGTPFANNLGFSQNRPKGNELLQHAAILPEQQTTITVLGVRRFTRKTALQWWNNA